MLERLLQFIAPHECLACSNEGNLLCPACQTASPALPPRCYHCRALSPDGATCARCRKTSRLFAVQAATEYTGFAKDLVWKLKFAYARAAVQPMAALIASRVIWEDDTLLVHVPTATTRVRQRGYDQAALLARELSRLTRRPRATLLARHGQSRQVGAGRMGRQEHLRQAFRVVRPQTVVGRHIVLVDDVLTTGATLEAAAAVLNSAGAKRVDAVVFAQA